MAGTQNEKGANPDWFVARLAANGTVDTSFGKAGRSPHPKCFGCSTAACYFATRYGKEMPMLFAAFAKKFVPKMRSAQEVLAKSFQIGIGGGFSYDQATMRLVFTAPNETQPSVVAKASILGSFSNESWMWAWANSSVQEPNARPARKIRTIGRREGWTELTTGEFFTTSSKVNQLLAAAFGILQPCGFYMVPSHGGRTVLVIHTVERVSPVVAPSLRPKSRSTRPSRPIPESERASETSETPSCVSIMITTTHHVKSKLGLKDKNVTLLEQRLSATIASTDFGMPVTVRLSLGLFPFDSDWGKLSEKKRLAPQYVKSNQWIVVERNIDYNTFRKLDDRNQLRVVKQCMQDAFSEIHQAKNLPAKLKVARLQSALKSAIARLPDVI